MSENNQFQPYRYNQQRERPPSYERPPEGLNISAANTLAGGRPRGIFSFLQNPVIGTAALILIAVAFVAIVTFSYPDGEDSVEDSVPIVKAEATPVKTEPEDAGGMEILHRDSTIFQVTEVNELPPVENLLDQEEPVSKLEAFAEQARAMIDEKPTDMVKGDAGEIQAAAVETEKENKSAEAKTEVEMVPDVASAVIPQPAKKEIHAPASSPETLAFVRSVLDKKDGKAGASEATSGDIVAETAPNIQPAAGVVPPEAIQPGNYFVQLASVTFESGAEGEWKKLQKKYSELSGIAHRVKRADLGERGVYYRIQAGPMSKGSADVLCASIKIQKSGSCLVTK